MKSCKFKSNLIESTVMQEMIGKDVDWFVFQERNYVHCIIAKPVLNRLGEFRRVKFMGEPLNVNWGFRHPQLSKYKYGWVTTGDAKELAVELEELIADAREPKVEYTVYHSG